MALNTKAQELFADTHLRSQMALYNLIRWAAADSDRPLRSSKLERKSSVCDPTKTT